MTAAGIQQAQRLADSCDHPDDEWKARAARKASPADAIEAGAMAIYGVVTQTDDPDKLAMKWARLARPKTKDAHRAEAEACLRATGRI